MPTIKETYQLAASDADVLASPSRLAAIPGDGQLTIEMSATDCELTNNGQVTLLMPDGSTPFENLLIPQNGYSTADSVIHDQTALQISVTVEQGGHVLLSYTETGTVLAAMFIFTLEF